MSYSIFKAIEDNDIEYVKNHKEEWNYKDLRNWIPLHYACRYNNFEIVKILVESKLVDIDTIAYDNNRTPLHIVCLYSDKYDNYKTIKYLINNDDNYLIIDKYNKTPLNYLKQYNFNNYNKIMKHIKYLKYRKLIYDI